MQRRAAAIYAAFFLVIAAGAYGAIGLAQEPTVSIDDPAYSLSSGDTLEAGGTTYTVGQVQAGSNEGDDLREVELSWVNQSARYTVTLENGSTVPADMVSWSGKTNEQEPYRVTVTGAGDPTTFALTQEFNVSGRLARDQAVEDQTVNRSDGRRYVVYRESGNTQLLTEYLPEPERRTFEEGGQLQYNGTATTIDDVSNESVTLTWTAPRNNTLSLAEGDTQTFGGTEYTAHFPDNSTFALVSDRAAYEREVATVDTFHERVNGFWGIVIISGLAALFLLSFAYLPSRY